MNYKIEVQERVSAKSGKSYKVLVITFANGYVFETFLNNEQAFCLEQGLRSK